MKIGKKGKKIPTWLDSSTNDTSSTRQDSKTNGTLKVFFNIHSSTPNSTLISEPTEQRRSERIKHNTTITDNSSHNNTTNTIKHSVRSSTIEQTLQRESRKRTKRTSPKKSLPTEAPRPTRVRSRNRFDDSKPKKHNRSKSQHDQPKNKNKPTKQDTTEVPKKKRGRPPKERNS